MVETHAGMSITDKASAAGEHPSSSPTTTEWGATLLKILGGIAVIFPILWAAYTYYHQEFQQRRQDFLRAYDIVHGALGREITGSIDKAIAPVYSSSDDKLAKARFRADTAVTPAQKAAAITDIQHWLVQNILVKDKTPIHDHQIQNYQQALRNLIFLYDYAKTDSCTALVVLYRFREYAYLFWYYYPGSYNFDGPQVITSPDPDPARRLGDARWLATQQDQCSLEPRI